MDDVIIKSKFPKDETIRRLQYFFNRGNSFGVELTKLHNEYYLSPKTARKGSFNPLLLQFRIKEDIEKDASGVSIHITTQTNALSLALGVMFLLLIWIFILVATLSEKRLLDPVIYLGGIGISLFMLIIFRFADYNEKDIINRLKKEFEA